MRISLINCGSHSRDKDVNNPAKDTNIQATSPNIGSTTPTGGYERNYANEVGNIND